MPKDVIRCEILPDGTIKSTTDKISPANHSTAEKFFTSLRSKLGGAMQRMTRGAGHHHHEHGQQTHEHQ